MTEPDVAGLTYERALAELDTLIARLEKGDVALDEAIACYERGSRLAQHCAALLDRMEQKVTQLVVGGGGRLSERPLDAAPGEAGTAEPAAAEPVRARTVEPRRETSPPIDPDDIPF